MVENISHFLGNGVRIDRYRHRAERLCGAHCPVETRSVRSNDGKLVIPLDPKLRESKREGAHLIEHLPPGPDLPDAQILVPISRSIRMDLGIADQELGKGICAS